MIAVKKDIIKTIGTRCAYHDPYKEGANKGAELWDEVWDIAVAMKLKVSHYPWLNHGCFSREGKEVMLPLMKNFRNTTVATGTMLHELAHAFLSNPKGKSISKKVFSSKDKEFNEAIEEVVVEMAAQIFMAEYGCRKIKRHSNAYIVSWLSKCSKKVETQKELVNILYPHAKKVANGMLAMVA